MNPADSSPEDGALAWAMVDASPDALVIADEFGTIELVNTQAELLFGHDRQDLVGQPVEVLLPKRFAKGHADHRSGFRDKPEFRSMGSGLELWASRKDGTELRVEVSLSPLIVQDQLRVMAAVRDISDRVALEQETEAFRERRQALKVAVSDVQLGVLEGSSRAQSLALVCQRAHEILSASTVMILTPGSVGDELFIESTIGLPPQAREQLHFSTTQGVAGQVYTSARAEFFEPGDPRITATNAEVMEQEQTSSGLMAPLRGSDQVVGVLVVVRQAEVGLPLNSDDLDALEEFASAAVIAIELAALRESKGRVELLEDRERIGRDMHDKVIGRLFAAGMAMQSTASRIEDPDVKQRLNRVVDELDDAIKEIRTTVFGLRSVGDWGRGVRGKILALAAEQHDSLGFEPGVVLVGAIDELDAPVVDALIASLREALTNVAKHAHPKTVTVSVSLQGQQLRLVVEDDGAGFDASAATSDSWHGHGLANILARAESLDGHCSISSAAGSGTTIEWVVPAT